MPRDKRKQPAYKSRQRRIKKLAKAREDCQLHGDIETVPVGAVRNEVVDPMSQGFQPLPGLIAQAVRNGYETPEENKIKQVDELHKIATDEAIEPHVRIAAIRTAVMADRDQWERDNPEASGKAAGSSTTEINIEQILAAVTEIEKQRGRRIGLPPAMREIEVAAEKLDAAEVLPPELDRTM